jgi:hypothetical protein
MYRALISRFTGCSPAAATPHTLYGVEIEATRPKLYVPLVRCHDVRNKMSVVIEGVTYTVQRLAKSGAPGIDDGLFENLMADSIRQKIVDAVIARMLTINGTGNYVTNVAHVEDSRIHWDENELPAISVFDGDSLAAGKSSPNPERSFIGCRTCQGLCRKQRKRRQECPQADQGHPDRHPPGRSLDGLGHKARDAVRRGQRRPHAKPETALKWRPARSNSRSSSSVKNSTQRRNKLWQTKSKW